MNGHLSIAKLLVSHGGTSDLKANDGGRPSVGDCVVNVGLLRLGMGCKAPRGKTPADVAEAKGHVQFAALLRSGGAAVVVPFVRLDVRSQCFLLME